MLLDKGIFKAIPLQTVAVLADVMTGAGLTVRIRFCAVPKHPAVEVGVIVYITF